MNQRSSENKMIEWCDAAVNNDWLLYTGNKARQNRSLNKFFFLIPKNKPNSQNAVRDFWWIHFIDVLAAAITKLPCDLRSWQQGTILSNH